MRSKTGMKAMRVLVDCTQISRLKAGVGVYAQNLLSELIQIDSDLSLFLLIQDDDPDLDFNQYSNVKLIRFNAKIFRKLPFRFLLEQLFIPLLAIKYKIQVIHSLHYSFPLAPMSAKKIVTIHDMTMFLIPETHLRFKVYYFRFFIRASIWLVDELIFVSRSTQNDYLRYFSKPCASCHIVPLGKSPLFRSDLDPLSISHVINTYGLKRPYILYIGTIEPRKNLIRLVEAFSELAVTYPDHVLVIAGMKGWMYEDLFELVRKFDMEKRVIFTGFVLDKDKPYLIKGCEIFVYPSLYEGFGLPLLEALSCGVPALTSNVSSLPEIAGDAALLVDPTSEAEIADGLNRLLGDRVFQDMFSKKAIKQASGFTWSKTAQHTLVVYQKAIQDASYNS
jgi:glycosyltransferase involved in cell wall biosynthesis